MRELLARIEECVSPIMYIESKAEGLVGPARIGRVSCSKTGKTLYYKGKSFQSLKGSGFNYFEVESRDQYWISGPRQDGADRLYVSNIPVEIGEDVKDEYFAQIRSRTDQKSSRGRRFP
jgi:hypothetical protein